MMKRLTRSKLIKYHFKETKAEKGALYFLEFPSSSSDSVAPGRMLL